MRPTFWGLTRSASSAPGLVSTTIDYDAAVRMISNIEIKQLDIGENVLTYYQQFATTTLSPFDTSVAGASDYDAAGNLLASRTGTCQAQDASVGGRGKTGPVQ